MKQMVYLLFVLHTGCWLKQRKIEKTTLKVVAIVLMCKEFRMNENISGGWRRHQKSKFLLVESPNLVLVNWWNLFVLTLCSKCGFEIGWSNSSEGARWHSWMEMTTWNEDHGDGVNTWWSSSGILKRRKRKTKWAQGKGDIYRAILFSVIKKL